MSFAQRHPAPWHPFNINDLRNFSSPSNPLHNSNANKSNWDRRHFTSLKHGRQSVVVDIQCRSSSLFLYWEIVVFRCSLENQIKLLSVVFISNRPAHHLYILRVSRTHWHSRVCERHEWWMARPFVLKCYCLHNRKISSALRDRNSFCANDKRYIVEIAKSFMRFGAMEAEYSHTTNCLQNINCKWNHRHGFIQHFPRVTSPLHH